MLQLWAGKGLDLLTDPSCCALFAFPQFDAGFLFLTSCMPSTAEYVLGALLLAGELGGDGEVVKLWAGRIQGGGAAQPICPARTAGGSFQTA